MKGRGLLLRRALPIVIDALLTGASQASVQIHSSSLHINNAAVAGNKDEKQNTDLSASLLPPTFIE